MCDLGFEFSQQTKACSKKNVVLFFFSPIHLNTMTILRTIDWFFWVCVWMCFVMDVHCFKSIQAIENGFQSITAILSRNLWQYHCQIVHWIEALKWAFERKREREDVKKKLYSTKWAIIATLLFSTKCVRINVKNWKLKIETMKRTEHNSKPFVDCLKYRHNSSVARLFGINERQMLQHWDWNIQMPKSKLNAG